MLRDSVNATATAGNIVQFLGDSFTEQVANYMAVDNTPSEKKVPIGWPIGVSLGSLAIVGAAVWLGFYVVHQRRRNRLQQVRCGPLTFATPGVHCIVSMCTPQTLYIWVLMFMDFDSKHTMPSTGITNRDCMVQ